MSRTIRVDGRDVPYRLVRTPLARGVRIRVGADGVVVSAPPHASERTIARALRTNAGRLARVLSEVASGAPSAPRAGDLLPYLGGAVRVGADIPLRPGDDPAAVVERWYRDRAREHLDARVRHWAPAMGVEPARVVVRGQRSRWGSASTRGTISLNWRLVTAPPRIADYVVVHELAHLVHMDHSPRFWAVVARHWPAHRRDRDWLRVHGAALLRGPAPLPEPGPEAPAG